MRDIIRDSTFGQLVNYFSSASLMPYADQRPGYVLPARFRLSSSSSLPAHPGDNSSGARTLVNFEGVIKPHDENEAEKAMLKEQGFAPHESQSPFLVDGDGDDDPDNPWSAMFHSASGPACAVLTAYRNWSRNKRLSVAGEVMLLTFSVYIFILDEFARRFGH